PLSWLRKRPAPAVPQYTRVGSRGSTATQSGDRPPKCSSTVQVEARRAINRAARVATTMPTMTQSPCCGSVLYDSYVNHRVKKILLDSIQRAFQRFGIGRGKLLGDILEHRVDHFGPGGMPFPSERGHFCAHGSPVSWIVDSFHQAVRLEAIHQLGNV